jgi:hypothetical protein
MRFGGITEVGRAKAYMRALKDQPIFASDHSLNTPRNESILHFAGPEGYRLSQASLVDIYLRAVSAETPEFNWKSLLGVQTVSFKLV